MEKVKFAFDELKLGYQEIKSRMANPFLFSFILSWCINNWVGILGFLTYTESSKTYSKYTSAFDFFYRHADNDTLIWRPLVWAILYVLLNPIIKNTIKIFYSWLNSIGETRSLIAAKSGKIPMERYLDLRDGYRARSERLEQIIASESKYQNQIIELEGENIKLKQDKVELRDEFTRMENRFDTTSDVTFLNGDWLNQYEITLYKNPEYNAGQQGEYIRIENGSYKIDLGKETVDVFIIRNFYYNYKTGKIQFIKERLNPKFNSVLNETENKYLINELATTDSGATFTGHEWFELGFAKIKLTRVQYPDEKK